jgi:hypothetical protein
MTKVFWDAFSSGLAGPSTIYDPIPPYALYVPQTTVAHSFAQVGLAVTCSTASMISADYGTASPFRPGITATTTAGEGK